MFKAIALVLCDIQKNFISNSENVHVNMHVFIKEYSVDISRKMTLTPMLLDNDDMYLNK